MSKTVKERVPDKLRQAVLERDGFACLCCGSKWLLSMDHVIPESQGGPTTFENLHCLCHPCNASKGDRMMSLPDLRRRRAEKLAPARLATWSAAHSRPMEISDLCTVLDEGASLPRQISKNRRKGCPATWADAAHLILLAAGKPLSTRELVERAIRSGLVETRSQRPDKSLRYVLDRQNHFVRVGPDTYALD